MYTEDDNLGRWLPNFNINGRRITVRRLLDHTSGICRYTEVPEARAILPPASQLTVRPASTPGSPATRAHPFPVIHLSPGFACCS